MAGLTSTTPTLYGSPLTAQVSSEKNYIVLCQSNNIAFISASAHTDCLAMRGISSAFRRLAAGPPSGIVAIVAGL